MANIKHVYWKKTLTWSNTLPLYTLMGYIVPNVIRAMAMAEAVSTAKKLLKGKNNSKS